MQAERTMEAMNSGALNDIPDEVKNALALTEEQLNERSLEELVLIREWLTSHNTSHAPEEHKLLLEMVEKLISYKMHR